MIRSCNILTVLVLKRFVVFEAGIDVARKVS